MEEIDSFDTSFESYNFATQVREVDRPSLSFIASELRDTLNWDVNAEEQLFNMSRGPVIVGDLLLRYRAWDQIEEIATRSAVLYDIVYLCFLYRIQDSVLVSDVLRQVHECDGHFSKFFEHVTASGDDFWFWGDVTQSSNLKKEHQAVLFFIRHAHRSKLEFSGVRFIDMSLLRPMKVPPAVLAYHYGKHEPLLQFLRYGAVLSRTPLLRLGHRYADDWGVSLLLRHLIRTLWLLYGSKVRNNEDDVHDVVMAESTKGHVKCLNIMLRVIPQIAFGELDFTLTSLDRGTLMEVGSSRDFIRWVSTKSIVPKLAARYLDPPELKHFSRCALRKTLNANWNLPLGVSSLPLSRKLKTYVDVGED